MILRGICLLMGLSCGTAETPPPADVAVALAAPPIAGFPLHVPELAKPPLAKPTGFPSDCPRQPPLEWQHLFVAAEYRTGVAACDGAKLAWCESRYRQFAVSPAGAQGPAQLMPATARDLGVTDPFDPAQAIGAMFRYLAWSRSQWSTDDRSERDIKGLGYCCYSWGCGACRKSQQVWGWYAFEDALPRWPQETQELTACALEGE